MIRWAQIVGGPRDGETVEYMGPVLYEPIRTELTWRTGETIEEQEYPLPEADLIKLRRYSARLGRRVEGVSVMRYVLDGLDYEGMGLG